MRKTKMISAAQILLMLMAASPSVNVLAETRSATSVIAGRAASTQQLSQSYTWFDGNREQTVWLNPQLVAEFNPNTQGSAVARNADARAKVFVPKRSQGAVRFWQMNNAGDTAVRTMAASNATGKYSPVFHVGSNNNSSMRALPGNIIVYLNPTWDATTVANWVKSKKLEVVKKLEIGPNIYVIKTAPGLDALNTANALYLSGEVSAAFPDWWQEVSYR
jgi:hypothetical protein